MISQSTIEEIKSRANLVEIIGETVQLRRQGSSYVGCCPFHNEKTPSFHIRDGGKYYHCFGCGVSGSAISYVMETRGLSFPDAIEDLAGRYGIKIELEKGVKAEKEVDKSGFFSCNRTAAQFFSRAMQSAPPEVKSYVKKRELSDETIATFGIGFSPIQWHALTSHLSSQKISEQTVVSLGLARRNQKGEMYDAFRGRLIFPIWSDTRKIVGFGGRIIPPLFDKEQTDQMPKYINSPESPVYQKNKILFGLPQAMAAIRQTGSVYIVEGYMDVVSLHQHGVKNVVATCGTALTEGHAKRLSYLCKRVFVLFDGDNAGRSAAAKSFQVFLNSRIDASVLFMPQGEDPDSMARSSKSDIAKLLAALPAHTTLNCYIDGLLSRFAADSVRDLGAALKGQLCEEVAQTLSKVQNAVERDELIRQAAFKLLVEPERFLEVTGKEVAREVVRAKNAADTVLELSSETQRKAVTELPQLDQQVLLAAMGQHDELCGKILSNAVLVESLAPVTINFIDGLSRIIFESKSSRDEKKVRTRELLAYFGKSWTEHWKKAHKVSGERAGSASELLSDCVRNAKKIKLDQSVIEIDRLIALASSEEERLQLASEKLEISRRRSQIRGNLQ